jgi:hypothetical protein
MLRSCGCFTVTLLRRGFFSFFFFALPLAEQNINAEDCRLNPESAWLVLDPGEKDKELQTWNL